MIDFHHLHNLLRYLSIPVDCHQENPGEVFNSSRCPHVNEYVLETSTLEKLNKTTVAPKLLLTWTESVFKSLSKTCPLYNSSITTGVF